MSLVRNKADRALIKAVREWAEAEVAAGRIPQPEDRLYILDVSVDGVVVECFLNKTSHHGQVGLQIRRSEKPRQIVVTIVFNKTTGKHIRTI
jgi:hypothetical protein